MKEKEILARLKSAIDDAPIDLLDNLKDAEVEKMTNHDHITSQDWQIENNPPKNQAGNEGFLAEKIIPISKYLRSFVIAASLVLVVSISTNHYLNMPIGEIYLDINPSFSVEIRRNNTIKDINPLNADAFEIVNGEDFENMTYDQALLKLVRLAEEEGYLKEDINLLMLSSTGQMKERVDKSAQLIEKDYENSNTDITIIKQRLESTDNIEMGYSALLERISEGESIPLEFLQGLGLEDLLAYLLSENIDLSKYVSIEGDLPKPGIKEDDKDNSQVPEAEEKKTRPSPPPSIDDGDSEDYGENQDYSYDEDDWEEESDDDWDGEPGDDDDWDEDFDDDYEEYDDDDDYWDDSYYDDDDDWDSGSDDDSDDWDGGSDDDDDDD